jgi:hypothetical protein
MTVNATTWEDISKGKQAARAAAIPAAWRLKTTPPVGSNVMNIPRECGILTPEEVKITETSAVDLVAAMVNKQYTSEQVTVAFSKRAAIAQQLTNCLTEIFFERGIAQAKALDAEYAASGKPKGLLHGLPISLKDHIGFPGVDSTVGFISQCNQPKTEADEADLVTVLRNAGAIFYCKTNVPTGELLPEHTPLPAATNSFRNAHGRLVQQRLGRSHQPVQHRLRRWRVVGWRVGSHRDARLAPRLRFGHWRLGPHARRHYRSVRPQAHRRPFPQPRLPV